MTVLFWMITLLMITMASLCICPWLVNIKQRIIAIGFIVAFVYPIYLLLGSSQYLPYYYSSEFTEIQAKLTILRPLLADLAKEKQRRSTLSYSHR